MINYLRYLTGFKWTLSNAAPGYLDLSIGACRNRHEVGFVTAVSLTCINYQVPLTIDNDEFKFRLNRNDRRPHQLASDAVGILHGDAVIRRQLFAEIKQGKPLLKNLLFPE